jgi:hypothetical protein
MKMRIWISIWISIQGEPCESIFRVALHLKEFAFAPAAPETVRAGIGTGGEGVWSSAMQRTKFGRPSVATFSAAAPRNHAMAQNTATDTWTSFLIIGFISLVS